MDESKSLNIYQRLAAITAEVERVAKNLEVSAGRGSYKAVSEADVLAAVKPLERKYGVYSYPAERSIEEQERGRDEGSGRPFYFERIRTVYRFVNVDNPEERIDITTYGDGLDSADKSVGKAMTYADKYALLKAYKIQTGEDPDATSSDSYWAPYRQPGQSRPAPSAQQPRKATENQMAFLSRLMSSKGLTDNDALQALGHPASGNITSQQASEAIEWAKAQPEQKKEAGDDELPF